MKINKCISAIALSTVILSGCSNNQTSSSSELTSPVSVQEVQLNSIRKYNSTTGTVIADAEVVLSSEMAGKYKLQTNPRTRQAYKLGDAVNKGDAIVRFEGEEFEISVSIESKKMNMDIADQELIKQKALYEKGGVTLSDLRNTEVKVITTRESYQSALLQLEKMKITAPFNGIIVNLPHISENAEITSGTEIVTVMSYSKMHMEINLPESAINEVQTGQKVFITHYTIPKDTISGKISELSPAVSSETRTFKGKLLIDNSKLKLHPGMFVKADIIVEQADSTIVIPKEIVMNNRGRKYVYVVEKGIAKMRTIRTGLEDQDNTEILEGLEVNDKLITRGYETLREDSKVKIQK
ncbi:MAG TPA: efflux RND transporter periplasmic adaptor subunit [Bacteroidales bacterium]